MKLAIVYGKVPHNYVSFIGVQASSVSAENKSKVFCCC